jgi:hypothetical protein
MAIPKGLILAATATLVCLVFPASAQLKTRTEAQFAGGYNPRACGYPPAARSAALSGCCQMELDIGTHGEVLKAEGTCSDPIFLEPTKRCLAVQLFVPATSNGQPVRAIHHLEYEWRSSVPSKENLCKRMKLS